MTDCVEMLPLGYGSACHLKPLKFMMFWVMVSCILFMGSQGLFRAWPRNSLVPNWKFTTKVSRPALSIHLVEFTAGVDFVLQFSMCVGICFRCVPITRRAWFSPPMRTMAGALERCQRPTRCCRTGRWAVEPSGCWVRLCFLAEIIWILFHSLPSQLGHTEAD